MGSIFGRGASLGIFVHIVTLAVLGSVSALAVLFIKPLRIETVSKGLILGLSFGIVSIPVGCVPFAILSKTPVLELLTLSTIPHIVWGGALGLVSGYKLRYSSFSGQGGEPVNL
jgi:hypothetical protein